MGEIAGRQHGIVARRQLFELGLTRSAIDRALNRRRLVPVHRGIYAVGHHSMPPYAPYIAAVLAVGSGAAISHGSAAALWELTPWRATGEEVEVTVAGRDAGRRRVGIQVHAVDRWHPADVTLLHNIPITTPARALLDNAPRLNPRELERAFDRGLKAEITTRQAVAETVARSPRRPSAARLAAVARAELLSPGETESRWEERLLALVRSGGLPEPELNASVGRFKIDALWRAQKLALEVDAYDTHGTRWSFESDRERDQLLTAAGFSVMRITRHQLETQPAVVLVRLAQRLAALEAQSGRSSRIVS